MQLKKYYRQKNMSLSGYSWEFNLVESKDVNAWCMSWRKKWLCTLAYYR